VSGRFLDVPICLRYDQKLTTAEHVRAGVRHPLKPLTAGEIETVSRILKRDRGLADSARFVYVTLREPAKDVVLKYQPGEAFDREAHVVIRERAERTSYEAVVSLTAGEVRLWREVPGVQPPVMLEEFVATEEAVRKDARWQEAMRRRGITDFDMVMIDPWSVCYKRPRGRGGKGPLPAAADLGAPG
jgi:primary-amine oxidase